MNRTVVVVVVAVVLVLVAGCEKDAPPPPRAPPPAVAAPAPPPPGSDGDKKRIAALDLATKVDAGLSTFAHTSKALAAPLAPNSKGQARKVDTWRGPAQPRKIVVAVVDDKGTVLEATDFYFDDAGALQLVRAPDGLFIFEMGSLALWLERDQTVKRGLRPALVAPRIVELKADVAAALNAK